MDEEKHRDGEAKGAADWDRCWWGMNWGIHKNKTDKMQVCEVELCMSCRSGDHHTKPSLLTVSYQK
jgi:hypothetical protein